MGNAITKNVVIISEKMMQYSLFNFLYHQCLSYQTINCKQYLIKSIYFCINRCDVVKLLLTIIAYSYKSQKKVQMVKTGNKKLDNFQVVPWSNYQNLTNFNKVSKDKLLKALKQNGRVNESDGHICGMHALNICFLIWGYNKQYTISTYPYKWIYKPMSIVGAFFLGPAALLINNDDNQIKWGYSSEQFGNKLINPNFDSYKWTCQYDMPWDLIDNTNYQTHSVIILIKCYDSMLSLLHYMVIIGKRNDNKQYLLIDDSEEIYLVSASQLAKAMKIDTPTLYNYNAYRVG